jgi:hypothetical protein
MTTTPNPSPEPLSPAAVDAALRTVIEFLDYDLHKSLECDEETGQDTYAEHVQRFMTTYTHVTHPHTTQPVAGIIELLSPPEPGDRIHLINGQAATIGEVDTWTQTCELHTMWGTVTQTVKYQVLNQTHE